VSNSDVLDARRASTLALYQLLNNVVSGMSAAPNELKVALGSQGGLSRYGAPSLGITGCALNTLKRSCTIIPGGFPALDALRRHAERALREPDERAAPRADTKRELQDRVTRVKLERDAATEDLALLTRMLEVSMHQTRMCALESGDPALIERCRREQEAMRDMLSLRQTSSAPLRLVPAGGGTDEAV
jgi:hypothetical protein